MDSGVIAHWKRPRRLLAYSNNANDWNCEKEKIIFRIETGSLQLPANEDFARSGQATGQTDQFDSSKIVIIKKRILLKRCSKKVEKRLATLDCTGKLPSKSPRKYPMYRKTIASEWRFGWNFRHSDVPPKAFNSLKYLRTEGYDEN
jgi:hypothetical protein